MSKYVLQGMEHNAVWKMDVVIKNLYGADRFGLPESWNKIQIINLTQS